MPEQPDPPPSTALTPAPSPSLDARAVERVLARAAALQTASPRASDGMSEAELLDVAREAGMSVEHVRRALAEERLRGALSPSPGEASDERGLAVRLAGPGRASVSRVVAGPAPAVLARLTQWLEREELMQQVRRLSDGGVWAPRRDVVGNLVRGLRRGGTPGLRNLAALGAAVVPLDDGRALVRLEADVSAGRRQRLVVGSITAATGALAAGTLLSVGIVADALMTVLLPLSAFPALAGGGTAWALARGHRATVVRTQVALERVLDQVEHGAPDPSPIASTLREVLDGVRRGRR